MKRFSLVSLVVVVVVGLVVSVLLVSGGSTDSLTTTPTLIGNVESTAWSQMMTELGVADSCATAETVRSDAQSVIDRGEPAAFDLETLRAHGERRAADEWLAVNCR
ncbi:MAG: hypothetical protein ACC683_07820 [Acidimicrobiia bacterium]